MQSIGTRTRLVMASAAGERVSSSTMEVFIDKVKQHPCLWKMSEICYRDAVKKDLAWEQIARECGMANSREAKAQWKKLRDSHREALRRRKTATGEPVPNLKPWKYEFLMEFIVSQSENSTNTSQDNQTDKTITDTSNNMVEIPHPLPELPFPISSAIEPEIRNRNQHFSPKVTDIFQDRGRRREQRKTERMYLRNTNIDMSRGQDALSNLFTSLCQKTRELPKYLQLRVQREIFESVSRAEEEALSLDTVNSATPTYSLPSYEYRIIKTDPDQSSPLLEGSPSPGASTDDT